MSVSAHLLTVLACPSCKGPVVWGPDKQTLVCRGEALAYPFESGIPVMLKEKAIELTPEQLQQVESL